MTREIETIIKVNLGYKLVGTIEGQKRKLCFVSGRQGNMITLLLVSGIATAKIMPLDHEFARVDLPDGSYNLSPCNKVSDLNEVAEICDIIRNSPDED